MQPGGANIETQRADMGLLKRPTGISTDTHGSGAATSGTTLDKCGAAGASSLDLGESIWVRWWTLAGPLRTAMRPLAQPSGTPADQMVHLMQPTGPYTSK